MPATKAQQSTARRAREESRRQIVEAAVALVRERPYAAISVGEVMERAGIGRTLFYRHFDDLADLLLRTGRAAIEELYEAQVALAAMRADPGPDAVRQAVELVVSVYERHGPVLRAATEAAASDELVQARQAALRGRFDELFAETLRRVEAKRGRRFADAFETARAMNLLAHGYLLDVFGHEPRVSAETAATTLSEIWIALLYPSTDE